MQFKNFVKDNVVLSDTTLLTLSDSELKKYQVEGLGHENVVEIPDMEFKVTSGVYNLRLNEKFYNIEVEELRAEFFGIVVTIDDTIEYRVEKIREINKYDLVRGFIQNLRKLEETANV